MNSGSESGWITIRPHGNEYPRIVSDVGGIAFSGASYWRLQGIEIEGAAQASDRDVSLGLWWNTTDASKRINGRGIAMNASFHIEITNCLIHHFPGAGLSNNDGAYITVADDVIYANCWWSTTLAPAAGAQLPTPTQLMCHWLEFA
jgi:hypothetical protein